MAFQIVSLNFDFHGGMTNVVLNNPPTPPQLTGRPSKRHFSLNRSLRAAHQTPRPLQK